MDTTFIVALTQAVAWSVTALVMACLARAPLFALIDSLRQLKYGNLEAQFDRGTRAVQANIAGVSEQPPSLTSGNGRAVERMRAAWREVEELIREAARNRLAIEDGVVPIPVLLRQLVSKGVLQHSTADSVEGLCNLHNLAEHAPPERDMGERVPSFVTMAQAIVWNVQGEVRKGTRG